MSTIEQVCAMTLSITDAEILQMRLIIKGQENYSHPFKNETQRRQHALAKYNTIILNHLVEMRRLLVAGDPKNL